MNCHEILDMVYEYAGDTMPLALRIRVAIHVFFCPRCTRELECLEAARDLLKTDFFPPSPEFGDSVMSRIMAEDAAETGEDPGAAGPETGVSFRSWVLTGLVVFFSLVTSFFGINFISIADSAGISFLLPMGITIGAVLSIYGAIFIGSHIKDLSQRFGLR
jgi:hypothetical protein